MHHSQTSKELKNFDLVVPKNKIKFFQNKGIPNFLKKTPSAESFFKK